ncbi:MAG: hypothetical protein NTV34_10575 [Proteobacteria bacterium]|nr:hypothetical protein [Pseudomonadota bacterium]
MLKPEWFKKGRTLGCPFLYAISLSMSLALLTTSCGNKNSFNCQTPTSGVPCNARSKDEDARIALDKGDMETAVTLLKQLVADEPLTYSRYPLLAAALAGRSGFDVFNIVKGNFGGDKSLIQSMGSFLPTPFSKGSAYDASLQDMSDSVATLNAVPLALRTDVSADAFAASCSLQLTLYQAAYSIMIINKYSYGAAGYDPSKLSTITAADAAIILQNLLASTANISGTSGAAASAAITSAYQSIQSQPGSTDQEKIAAYAKGAH